MDFKECIRMRIAKDVNPDRGLVNSLVRASKNKLDTERKLELSAITASSKITLLYDSLRELLEALAVSKGFKIYNPECYTSFLKEVLKESLLADEFDTLRKIRNSINYCGKEVSVEDAKDLLKRILTLRESVLVFLK